MTDTGARNAKAEASVWLARLRADDCSESDHQEFQHWLRDDPKHAHAFEAINSTWENLGGLSQDIEARVLLRRSRFSRRRVLMGAGALVGLGTAAGYFSVAQATVYQTEVGKQKHVMLDDGTKVFLDTDTKLAVNFGFGQHNIELQSGRANFSASPQLSRPFVVKADEQRIFGGGSIFDVTRDEDRVSVFVIKGSAMVGTVSGGASSQHELLDGQQLIVTRQQTILVPKPNLAQLLAWQTGQAIFRNDSVSEAVYELNRYSQLKLHITDKRIANLRISGVYRVGDNAMFARALSELLPISIRPTNQGIELTGDNSRMRAD